ncbi:hypothetical protein EGW08_007332 [Elysia chlorotica]|uniref:Uncharacterized protein n=1 Tax=Elysia chlorotica TaxID=188477 RepID=A0A433TTN8_ELYCH|nr:hypothetical protein EGW08_007332 [Elysia chlorotica]
MLHQSFPSCPYIYIRACSQTKNQHKLKEKEKKREKRYPFEKVKNMKVRILHFLCQLLSRVHNLFKRTSFTPHLHHQQLKTSRLHSRTSAHTYSFTEETTH